MQTKLSWTGSASQQPATRKPEQKSAGVPPSRPRCAIRDRYFDGGSALVALRARRRIACRSDGKVQLVCPSAALLAPAEDIAMKNQQLSTRLLSVEVAGVRPATQGSYIASRARPLRMLRRVLGRSRANALGAAAISCCYGRASLFAGVVGAGRMRVGLSVSPGFRRPRTMQA